MSSLLALLAVLPFGGSVTLDVPIQRLDVTLKTLSERTGQSLGVAANLGGEMVRVKVRDVPVDTLLAQLAACTHAEWMQVDGRRRLERSPARERALATSAAAYRQEAVRRALAKLPLTDSRPAEDARKFRETITKMAEEIDRPGPESGARYRSLRTKGWETLPAYRIARRLAPLLNLTALVQAPGPHGITYSTRPVGVQRPFPPAAQAVIDRFRSDQNAFFNALWTWDRMAKIRQKPEPVARVLVHTGSAGQEAGDVSLLVEVVALSEEGRQIATAVYELNTEAAEPAKIPYDPPSLTLSPLSASVEQAFDPEHEKPWSPEVVRILRHPEATPRFRYAWSEAVAAIAITPNVVANLTDRLEHNSPVSQGRVDLAEARRTLLGDHEIVAEGEWTTIRPRYPDAAGVTRHHRAVEGSLIRLCADEGPFSIEEAAAIPARDRDTERLGQHPIWSSAEANLIDETLSEEASLSLLFAIEPGVRARLLQSGGALVGAQFGPALRTWIVRNLLEGPRLEFVTREAADTDEDAFEKDSSGSFSLADAQVLTYLGSESIEKPVSDFLRSSADSQAVLTVHVQAQPALFCVDDDLDALRIYYAEQFEELIANPKLKAARFRPVRFREVTLQFEFGGGYVRKYEIRDWLFDPKAKPRSAAELRSWFKPPRDGSLERIPRVTNARSDTSP